MKREFLMLAHKFGERDYCSGWLCSEKMDGQLALWDGGISRGLAVDEVPYANNVKRSGVQVATGLWSRYGKVIAAPDWWLDSLPGMPLAGELWMGRGRFQETQSCVRRHVGGPEWREVGFWVFDSPSLDAFGSRGRLHIRDWRVEWGPEVWAWMDARRRKFPLFTGSWNVERALSEISSRVAPDNPVVRVVPQEVLPLKESVARARVEERVLEVVGVGGEGLILRHPSSYWVPERSVDYRKVKPQWDAEGVVVGFRAGKITDDGSRLLGMMGSLLISWGSVEFEISGFTDSERTLSAEDSEWATLHQGWVTRDRFPLAFPRGTVVSFRYLGLTVDGIPRSANYWRKRDES